MRIDLGGHDDRDDDRGEYKDAEDRFLCRGELSEVAYDGRAFLEAEFFRGLLVVHYLNKIE